MKHKTFRRTLAALLAAALLAGCGAETATPASAAAKPAASNAAPAGMAELKDSPAAENAEDPRITEQTAAEPPALPEDWQQQVLGQWMAVTAVTQGDSYAPADRNESVTLRLEQDAAHRVTATLTHEKYIGLQNLQIQSDTEARAGTWSAEAVARWDGETSPDWSLMFPQKEGGRWTVSRMEDGSLLLRAEGPEAGSTVWYEFRRTEVWDDIGYTAIPRRLWGTYRAGDEAAKGIRWMTFLPDGSCCMDVEWGSWKGLLTGTAEGTQGRTEDGTELHFTLTDTDGRPCEFWAILLNDDGSPSGCSLKYRAGEELFDRGTRPAYWKSE